MAVQPSPRLMSVVYRLGATNGEDPMWFGHRQSTGAPDFGRIRIDGQIDVFCERPQEERPRS